MEISEKSEPPSKRELPLQIVIPNIPQNRVFYENGLSKLIPRLTLKVHSNLDICEELWKSFSPNESLYQLWDFRVAWYGGYRYTPYFYTLYLGKKAIGTLPLWYNSDEAGYEWFGGYWPEDNLFFVKDPEYIPLFLQIAPKPISLNAILPEFLGEWEKKLPLIEDECKYVLTVGDVSSIDELLIKKVSKKHRHNLRYEYGKIMSHSPSIQWQHGYDEQTISHFRDLSVQRFGVQKNDGSAYLDNKRYESLKSMYRNEGDYQLLTLTVKIQNHFAVIDIVGLYNGTYYLLTGANDAARFPGIGVFVTYLEFEDAIGRKMKNVDVMQIDNNWKHKYFSAKRLLKFEKS